MNSLRTMLNLLLTLTTLSGQLLTAKDVTKYVQGGASAPFNGTKHHPFGTLAQAEADQANWDTLIVLSSSTILDGGITLLDGKKLIGEKNPTCGELSPTQPTITNTDIDNSNLGNGVIVKGNATVQNIYFINTQASAINFNDADDLTIKNVLITKYGQTDFGAAALWGISTKSGTTTIEHCIIRDSINGPEAIRQATDGSIHRKLSICSSEFSELADSALEIITRNNSKLEVSITDSSTSNAANMVEADSRGASTLDIALSRCSCSNLLTSAIRLVDSQDTSIMNVTISDCSFDTIYNSVIATNSEDQSSLHLTVCNSTFTNTPNNADDLLDAVIELEADDESSQTVAIIGSRFSNNSIERIIEAIASNSANLQVHIRKCHMKEVTFNPDSQNIYIRADDTARSHVIIKDTESAGRDFFVQSDGLEESNITLELMCNKVTDNIFFSATSGREDTEKPLLSSILKGNTFNGTTAVNVDGQQQIWDTFNLELEDNCFTGTDVAFNIRGKSTEGIASHATINAHCNNVAGFVTDIKDDSGGITYNVSKNWWGPSPDCTTCNPQYQKCLFNACFGPKVVVSGSPTSNIDSSNPLLAPIKCVKCCCKAKNKS